MSNQYPNRPAPWNIGVVDFEVVLYTNPELADVGNPEGRVWGTRWMVMAEASDGRRMLYEGIHFDNREEAERFSSLFSGWDPEEGGFWIEVDPCYGSESYANEDVEFFNQLVEERLEAEI